MPATWEKQSSSYLPHGFQLLSHLNSAWLSLLPLFPKQAYQFGLSLQTSPDVACTDLGLTNCLGLINSFLFSVLVSRVLESLQFSDLPILWISAFPLSYPPLLISCSFTALIPNCAVVEFCSLPHSCHLGSRLRSSFSRTLLAALDLPKSFVNFSKKNITSSSFFFFHTFFLLCVRFLTARNYPQMKTTTGSKNSFSISFFF